MLCNIIKFKYQNKNISDINIHKTYILITKPIYYNEENPKSCFIGHNAALNGAKRLNFKNYFKTHSCKSFYSKQEKKLYSGTKPNIHPKS